ncbi:MAG: minor capsid protein [Peptostreptococcaceae bacterium]
MADGVARVTLDQNKIKSKVNKGIEKAQTWLDNEIIADTSKYTPFMTGHLDKQVRATGKGVVEYDVPYARKMYYGDKLNFNKIHHPLAGAFWFERSKAVHKAKWSSGVNKIVRGEL